MKIKYTNFTDGVHNFILTKSSQDLGLGENYSGDVQLNCKLDKMHTQMIFYCNTVVKAKFNCDRCTKRFNKLVESNFQLTYFFGSDDTENDNQDIFYINNDVDTICFDNEVKEYILISLDLKRLCNDECKGLCSGCGKDLNIEECICEENNDNPVWDKLKELKNKLNN